MRNDSTQTYDQAQSVKLPAAVTGSDAGTTPVVFPLPPELLAKLRAAEGEGLSHDPKNNPRKTIKLLTDKDDEVKPGSNWYREGARAGQYSISDRLCDNFILTPILYLDVYVEWKPDSGGFVDTHYVLPDDAKWDPKARCYFRANGNSVEDGADIVGLVDHDVCWLTFRGPAVTVARAFNSAAGALTVEKVRLPFFGGNWRIGSVAKRSAKGKSYWQTTYEHIANVGQPGGPTWDDFDRGRALCCILTKSIKPATVAEGQGTTDKTSSEPPFWENPPRSDAPPPTGDDPPRTDEDLDKIPF
jgi:hypothetical protein